MINKTALIFGVCGQDGSYLSRLLISKGYIVWGTTRDIKTSSLVNLEKLEVKDKIKLVSLLPHNFQNVLTLLQKSSPDEVYYLAGQSSVGLSFEQPTEALNSNVLGIINILESCRLIDKQIRVYYAGSSECFGDTNLSADIEVQKTLIESLKLLKLKDIVIDINHLDLYSLIILKIVL